jgi:hypothetical protein
MAALRTRKMRRAADHVNTRSPSRTPSLSEQSSTPGPSANRILVPDRPGLSGGVVHSSLDRERSRRGRPQSAGVRGCPADAARPRGHGRVRAWGHPGCPRWSPATTSPATSTICSRSRWRTCRSISTVMWPHGSWATACCPIGSGHARAAAAMYRRLRPENPRMLGNSARKSSARRSVTRVPQPSADCRSTIV